jgi:hypothetical protein
MGFGVSGDFFQNIIQFRLRPPIPFRGGRARVEDQPRDVKGATFIFGADRVRPESSVTGG